jgi:Signal transduction histidine kinase
MRKPLFPRAKAPNFVRRISTKVALSYVIIALLQGGLSILTLYSVTMQAMEVSLEDQRVRTRKIIEGYISDSSQEMFIKSELLAGQGELVGLLARGDYATLAYELSFYLKPLGLDSILIVDNEGKKIVSVGDAQISDFLLKRNPLDLLHEGYTIAATGGGVLNLNSFGNRIQLWSLREMSQNGKVRGTLCMAQSLDHSYIGRIEEISGTQMLLALRKTILVNGRVSDNVFIEYDRRVTADPEQGASGRIKSFVYRTTRLPQYPELELVYFMDTAPSTALLSRYVKSTLLILAATLVVAFVTSMALYRLAFQKPFASFQDAIRRISAGDLAFQFSEGTDDEFAVLEREFEDMTTNLRKLENEVQINSRMAAVGEMVAGVAHQIRNPLAIMKVSAEMARDALPAQQASAPGVKKRGKGKTAALAAPNAVPEANIRPLVDVIIAEIDSLNAVISRFLDFTRPLKVNFEDVEVEEFLSRATAFAPTDRFPDREVRVEVEAGAEVARFDRRLMEQVLRNLVANALEASEPGSEVLVSARRADGRFILAVSDHGRGMDEETRSQLFHPFFTTKSEGTGLGLSIVHRIIEEQGGEIDVRSEPGKGTEFVISLREGSREESRRP